MKARRVRRSSSRTLAILAAGAIGLGAAGCNAPKPTNTSEVAGASLVALKALPRSPETSAIDPYCRGYEAEKLTATGRQVASLGWIVTSEAPLGRYQVVTFVSGFTPGTSGICFGRNANIGIFEAGKLMALAYSAKSAEGLLGVVEPLESGALLIWGADGPGPPVGELRDEEGRVRLTAVAKARSYCGRRAVVPNVYGKPLDTARKALIAGGWRPQRPSEAPEWGSAADLAKAGVIEVEDCSGTGVGYCGFKYRGAVGVLSVITIGGGAEPAGNRVVSYDVDCAAR